MGSWPSPKGCEASLGSRFFYCLVSSTTGGYGNRIIAGTVSITRSMTLSVTIPILIHAPSTYLLRNRRKNGDVQFRKDLGRSSQRRVGVLQDECHGAA